MEGVNALENFADDRVVVVPNEKHGLTLSKDRAAYVKGDNIQRMNETGGKQSGIDKNDKA